MAFYNVHGLRGDSSKKILAVKTPHGHVPARAAPAAAGPAPMALDTKKNVNFSITTQPLKGNTASIPMVL